MNGTRPVGLSAPNRPMLPRPRLLSAMQGRFERRVTALVAGPGFGKSTLLVQAVHENELSPHGNDVWVGCTGDEAAASVLASGLLTSLESPNDAPSEPAAAARTIADAVWTRTPRQIALLFDDIHVLPQDSPGRSLLTALLEVLPANGHVVVASRPPLGLRLARLLALGDALVLDENALAFVPTELSAFAAERHVPDDVLADVGGWPALAELAASASRRHVFEFLWEEVLEGVGDATRDLLTVLAAVGRVDDALASEMRNTPTDVRALLQDLPLVSSTRDGWWSLHPLWQVALDPYLRQLSLDPTRRRAANALRRRGMVNQSMRLLIDAGAWDDVRDLVVEISAGVTPGVPPDVLSRWHDLLPDWVRQTPEGLLLAGTVTKADDPWASQRLLRQAAASFHSTGRVDAELRALQSLFHIAYWQNDTAEMERILLRSEDMAAQGGPADAAALGHLGRALLAVDPARAREELDGVPHSLSGPLAPIADWLRAHIMLLAGDAEYAEALARQALPKAPSTLRASIRCELVEAVRLQGRLEEAEEEMRRLLDDVSHSGVRSPRHVAVAIILHAFGGRTAEARQLLPAQRSSVFESHLPWAQIADAFSLAACAVAEGDEAEAARLIRTVLDHRMARPRVLLRISPAALVLSYVLIPESRPGWDSRVLGAFVATHRLTSVLVALREQRAELPRLSAAELRVAPAHLPIPWSVELCVGLAAHGELAGLPVVQDLGSRARPTLRRLEESASRDVSHMARSLLARIPPAPRHRLELRVLGPLTVVRDGEEVDDPDVHRERVRQLLGHLVLNRRMARATAASALWPDFDEAVAARNLRVTLNYLQHVLEPDRDERDAPFFLRTKGTTLELSEDPSLDVDAWAFERHLRDAAQAEQQGAPSVALEAYLRATDRYQGDFLSDLPQDDRLVQERDRLRRSFVAAAVRAGNLLLAGGDENQPEQLASRVLAAEPWSEPAYQLLARVALARGDRAAASRALDRCFTMLEEIDALVAPETLDLAEQVRRGTSRAAPRAG